MDDRHQILKRVLGVEPGQRVLFVGGNGSVGRAAIGLASRFGIDIWVTASERHRAILEAEGARVFPREGWAEAVRAAGGVDAVVDGVAADGFRSGFQALRPGGTLVAIGMSAVLARGGGILGMGWAMVQLGLRHLWPDGRRGTFYSITSYRAKHRDHWTADLTELLGWLERDHIAPVVGERLTLDDVADAHRRLEAGGLSGKLVLEPWA